MGRRASRETVMKVLYQLDIQKENREEQIAEALEKEKTDENDMNYMKSVLDGVRENKNFLDKTIKKYLKSWSIDRISRVDLSILRLSIYELYFRDDIPSSVSINEAIELSKKYSGKDSPSFINGVLGRVTRSGMEFKKT